MPIKRCTLKGGGKGWKYGSSGHCYSKRSDCVKQMRAMFANGYKGHSKGEKIPTTDDMISLLISDIDENDTLFYEICKNLNLTIGSITLILEKKKENKKKKKTKYPDPPEDDEDEEEDVNDDDEEDEDD